MRLRSATTTTTTTTTQLLTRTISSLGKQTKTRTASKSILSASSKKSTSKTAKKREHITAHYEDNTKQEIDVKLEEVEIKTEEESKPSHRDNWKEAWDLINDFRQSDQGRADVDVMGCAVLGRTEFGRKVFRFETLVALMLSAQTADKHLAPVLRKLQSMAPEGLTPDALITMGKKTLEEHLRPIGMQDKKSNSLIAASKVCKEQYDGDIPPTFESLMELNGVADKIAALVMAIAWEQPEVAIAVDTHVNRISHRLGWVKTKRPTPKETRKALEEWLPKEHWYSINQMLVGFGQTICEARKPKCQGCPVESLCPKIGVTRSMKRGSFD